MLTVFVQRRFCRALLCSIVKDLFLTLGSPVKGREFSVGYAAACLPAPCCGTPALRLAVPRRSGESCTRCGESFSQRKLIERHFGRSLGCPFFSFPCLDYSCKLRIFRQILLSVRPNPLGFSYVRRFTIGMAAETSDSLSLCRRAVDSPPAPARGGGSDVPDSGLAAFTVS